MASEPVIGELRFLRGFQGREYPQYIITAPGRRYVVYNRPAAVRRLMMVGLDAEVAKKFHFELVK